MINTPLIRVIVITGLLLAVPEIASAHAVDLDARLRGDHVVVEVFFDDNAPASNARVQVVAEDGETIMEGRTDEKGVWSFLTPPPGKYQIAADAGAGHLAKKTITIPPPPVTLTNPPATHLGGPMASDPEEIVSDGLTRAETTGPRRWLRAGAGLVVIGFLTVALRLAIRKRSASGSSEGKR